MSCVLSPTRIAREHDVRRAAPVSTLHAGPAPLGVSLA